MKSYNRDLYEKGLEAYKDTDLANERGMDFAVGFFTGAMIGSAIGLVLKPFVEQKVNIIQNEKIPHIHAQSQQLREEAIRKAEEVKQKAKKIKEEKRDNQQEQKNKQPTALELEAQRRSIQKEVESDRLAAPVRTNREEKKEVAASSLAAMRPAMAVDEKVVAPKKEEKKEAAVSSLAAMRQAMAVDEKVVAPKKEEKKEAAASSLAAMRQAMAVGGTATPKEEKQELAAQQKTQSHHNSWFDQGVITHEKPNPSLEKAQKTDNKVDKHTFNK
ncbi:hypothetical protein [Staphylococcus sp. 17KM0847]|uniref:hypothetical protein n=1 Tax=Staphylococcus sp. 17KM0847 TaxID=2583989 RepID=UPI0015DC57D3|nr:hypothetical protein [Staphylococcus sp. 17KM0847]QLK86274.1 hypothetical protein FGL66_05855 [Staphylococcus sp. 17KM0847]